MRPTTTEWNSKDLGELWELLEALPPAHVDAVPGITGYSRVPARTMPPGRLGFFDIATHQVVLSEQLFLTLPTGKGLAYWLFRAVGESLWACGATGLPLHLSDVHTFADAYARYFCDPPTLQQDEPDLFGHLQGFVADE